LANPPRAIPDLLNLVTERMTIMEINPMPTELPAVPPVTLGRSGLISSRLGLGTGGWPLERTQEQVVEILSTALDCGICHLDMAPLYRTEEIIGRALRELELPAGTVLATKMGFYQDDLGILYRNYTAAVAHRSVERSLKRLGVDVLSIVHIHDVKTEDLPQVFATDGALRGLLELKQQGVIGSIGMATRGFDCLQAAINSGEVDHIQTFHTYTLLNQTAQAGLFPQARARNLSILNAGPLAGFILATGAKPGALYSYKPASPQVMEAVQRLETLCTQKGVPLPVAALAFSLRNPDIDVTIIGADSPAQVKENVEALTCLLTAEDFEELVAMAGGPFPPVS
jgi:D-threo-aldose 1-dehydrogenase